MYRMYAFLLLARKKIKSKKIKFLEVPGTVREMLDNFFDAQWTGKTWKDDVLNKNWSCHKQEKKNNPNPCCVLRPGKN